MRAALILLCLLWPLGAEAQESEEPKSFSFDHDVCAEWEAAVAISKAAEQAFEKADGHRAGHKNPALRDAYLQTLNRVNGTRHTVEAAITSDKARKILDEHANVHSALYRLSKAIDNWLAEDRPSRRGGALAESMEVLVLSSTQLYDATLKAACENGQIRQ